MQNNNRSYDLLKELISRKSVTNENLEEIKKGFEEEIESPRRYSCIRTLEELFDVLERRNELNENNIEALKDLGYYFDDEEINGALRNYHEPEEYELENEYALQRIQYDTEEQLRINSVNTRRSGPPSEFEDNVPAAAYNQQYPTAPSPVQLQSPRVAPNNPLSSNTFFEGNKRELIYKLISKEIGRRWRELGREIGIREGEMDNLESDYPRHATLRIRKMLELFEEEEREDPRKIVFRICTALKNCRRADLGERVQEIMTR